PEAFIVVTRSSGHRTIFYQPTSLPRLTLADLPAALFHSAGVVLLDPETTYLADYLPPSKPGTPVIVYDGERWRKGLEAMMVRANYFIPSSELLNDTHLGLAGLPFPEQFRRLADRIGGCLIVTRGRRGAYFWQDGQLCRVPAPAVEVKDTIGAGDNFHAAFALALLRGDALPPAVKFSVAVASLSCRAYGGREGVPDLSVAQALASSLQVASVGGVD
ncbi:MAG: PfkB family carbohydrate kinase, partial [Oceanisphaera sp.]|nr:PfkB family carbohydrate kinase [Oceanisphaera sp.]